MDDIELDLFAIAAVTSAALACNARMKRRKVRRKKRSVWVRPLFQRRGKYGAVLQMHCSKCSPHVMHRCLIDPTHIVSTTIPELM